MENGVPGMGYHNVLAWVVATDPFAFLDFAHNEKYPGNDPLKIAYNMLDIFHSPFHARPARLGLRPRSSPSSRPIKRWVPIHIRHFLISLIS